MTPEQRTKLIGLLPFYIHYVDLPGPDGVMRKHIAMEPEKKVVDAVVAFIDGLVAEAIKPT